MRILYEINDEFTVEKGVKNLDEAFDKAMEKHKQTGEAVKFYRIDQLHAVVISAQDQIEEEIKVEEEYGFSE